ncbi:MAG: matrixin family metalloprotease [Armatimonadetes bacterium]|nr:matrixin family metalloprotease [Armatimonadota bacterium]
MLRVSLIAVAAVIGATAAQAEVVKDGDLRVLRIRACADDEMRARGGWVEEIQEHLAFASGIFESTFGIRFRVEEVVEWDSDDAGQGLGDLVDELEADMSVEGVDAVVGFSAQDPRAGKLSKYVALPWGLTPSLGRVSMIRAMVEDESYDLHLAVVHEVAHLFGAFHVTQQDSVMRETVQGPRTFQFDTENGKLIRLMRDYDFEAGVEAIDPQTAERLTALWKRGGGEVDTSPLAEALFNRGIELYNEDRPEDAIALWKRSIRADDRFALAYGTMGVTLAELERYDEALEALKKADELGWPEAKQAMWLIEWREERGEE